MNKCKKRLYLFCLIISLLLTVAVSAVGTEVYVGGIPFGIRFDAGEVSVIKTNPFVSGGETVCPAEEAGLIVNDVIKTINGVEISSSYDVVNTVKSAKSDTLNLVIERNGKTFKVDLRPKVSDKTGEKQLGVMLKDSSAGIGTVTFVKDDTLTFAGLGHGICDAQSGEILNIKNGYISDVTISSINMGKCGTPGELRGIIETEKCGKLLSNTEVGVYGVFTEKSELLNLKSEIAAPEEVKSGKATILCTLDDNERKEYEIEILEIHNEATAKTKNYVVRVTDENLLEKTGGIVQGMSGSPIMQNGKIVGAITHVMINDPTTGYGIYIGNMLEEMDNLA